MHSRAVGLHVKLLEREFAIASDFKYCRASGKSANDGEILRARLLRLKKQNLWCRNERVGQNVGKINGEQSMRLCAIASPALTSPEKSAPVAMMCPPGSAFAAV